jgi:hypothetical protein
VAYVMTLKQGEDFYVNDVRFVLTEIVSSAAVKIQRDSDGKLFQMAASMAVSAHKSVSIDPGVSYRENGGHTKIPNSN